MRNDLKNLKPGEHILKSALIAKDSQNRYMIQVVADGNGDYAIPIGTVKSNEESLSTMVRELYEEQGLNINPKDLNFYKRKKVTTKAIWDIYYIEKDIKKEDMTLQLEEVSDILFLTYDELTKIFNNKYPVLRKSTYETVEDFEHNKNT